ncbi:phage tail tape measure protein [Edwardsiella tarda]|uniref:phage tail tape measure protein n=1 Tax=Edwardsiella tarda TaxID=636 RepID=UPI003F65A1BA
MTSKSWQLRLLLPEGYALASETDLEIIIGANTAKFRDSMKKAREDIHFVNEEMRAAAASVEEGADNISAGHIRATQRLLRSIDPTLRAIDSLEGKQKRVEKAFRDGKISIDEFSRAMQVLSRDLEHVQAKERLQAAAFSQATAAMQRQEQVVKKMNISMGQYRNAVGMLPAQMTDIVTQLAGGQNPLLILLQQGGQVKDSFGGIRNMFLALRTVISPVALGVMGVVGGLGSLAYAYYKAEQEEQAFNRGLVMTGHYAGKTRSELQALASSLSGNGITQGKMAEVLAQTVSSGAFTGSSVSMVANAAARLEQATGASIDATIEQFKRLQQDPVTAVKALDEQMHFLTATQLEQITTLASQGREQEAARVAMDAYATAIHTQTAGLRENLGALENAWRAVKETASGAWDAMLSIGRDVPIRDRVEQTRRQLEEAEKNLSNLKQGTIPGFGINTGAIEKQQQLVSQLRKQLGELSEQSYQEAIKSAREKAERNEQERQKRQFNADQQLKRQYETAEEQHLRNLARIKNSYASKEVKELAIKRENERYEKSLSHGGTTRLQGDSLADSYSQRLAKTREALRLERAGAQRLTQSEQDLIALRQRLNDLKGRSLTKTEQSVVANAAVLEKLLSQNIAEEKALEHQKALNELKRKGAQLSMQLGQEAEREQQARELELRSMGMGDLARGRMRQEAELRDHYARLQDELKRSAEQKGTLGSDEYNADVQMLQDSLDQRLHKLREYYASVDAMRADWHVGASRSMQNIKNMGDDVAGATGAALTGAFNRAADSLANFVTTGKTNFRSLTSSILSDLARIAARMALSKSVSGLFSGIGGSSSGVLGGLLSNLIPNALGGVYESPNLSAYSGKIVSTPTLFAFARGAGLMGEAGPEAIMPLTRDSRGRLAVTAIGMEGRRASFSPTLNVVINNDGRNGEIGPGVLRALKSMMERTCDDYMQRQGRDGGRLSGGFG